MGHILGEFDGMQINKSTPPIPILCFDDDCITFCKNNKKIYRFHQKYSFKFGKRSGIKYKLEQNKSLFL